MLDIFCNTDSLSLVYKSAILTLNFVKQAISFFNDPFLVSFREYKHLFFTNLHQHFQYKNSHNFIHTQDPPEQGVLYLTRGLLNCIQHYEWENPSSKMSLYLQVLSMLAAATQESYPYHINKG
jgi:hypothetical protein